MQSSLYFKKKNRVPACEKEALWQQDSIQFLEIFIMSMTAEITTPPSLIQARIMPVVTSVDKTSAFLGRQGQVE
jgi:hypothetical protein